MNSNIVELSGVITSELEFSYEKNGECFYTTEISIVRISGATDKIQLILSDVNTYVDKPLLGEYVYVVGSIRTHNDKSDGKAHLRVFVYVQKIRVLDIDGNIVGENMVHIKGCICKIGNKRKTPLGRTITDTIIACNRLMGNDYIPVIFWGKSANEVSRLDIGTEIEIFGRLQSRNYIKNNIEHTVYEVSAQSYKEKRK